MADTNPFRRAKGWQERGALPGSAESVDHAMHAAPLTPLRAHYLKKTLVDLQLEQELHAMQRPDALELLGPPFRTSSASKAKCDCIPIVRHLVRRFVLTFPFFQSAPPDFFSNKVQLFVERLLERDLIKFDEGIDASNSVSMMQRMRAYLCTLVSAGMRVKGIDEEIVRITDADRQRLSAMDAQRRSALNISHDSGTRIDIVSVRRTVARGRIRQKTLDEFIICTQTNNQKVYVARRYSAFQRLYKELRARFPTEDVPELPPKDMSATEVNGAFQLEDKDGEYMDLTAVTPNALPRERNRLTLRAFLRSILATSTLADSDAFHEFLVNEPTVLTSEDKADADVRRKADAVRDAENKEFSDKMAERAGMLQAHFDTFKKMLMEPDGLSRVFATIRTCANVSELPPEYKVLVDWATVSMASGLFSMFVGRDSSSRAFAHLKYMHSMMPYFVVRSILRISNPVAMMRAFLDLFLAQPFGQKSLLQRMYTGQLNEELNEIRGFADNVRAKIPDAAYIEKVQAFIALPQEMQRLFHEQAEAQCVDVLVVVLRSPLSFELGFDQIEQVNRACIAYQQVKKQRAHARAHGLPEPEPNSDDAWLLEDLHVYMNLASAIHVKEQIISLVHDNATADLLKDMVTIFYAPLAQVYRVANISDTLGDVQVFINDLIKTVEENTALQASNPDAMVSAFVSLVQRHQQTFYHFVHQVHTKGSDLFQRLIKWIELFVNYVRDPKESEACGLGYIDLELCLARSGVDRNRVMREVDQVIQQVYKRKVQRELKRRRKLASKAVAGAADAPQGEEAFINSVSEQFGFGSSLQDEIEELDEESYDDDASGTDFSDLSDESGPEDADGIILHRERTRMHRSKARDNSASAATTLATPTIKAMLPSFISQLFASHI